MKSIVFSSTFGPRRLWRAAVSLPLVGIALLPVNAALAQENQENQGQSAPATPTAPTPLPLPPATPTPPPPPPVAQAYVAATPRVETSRGRTMVPITFLIDGLGASAGRMPGGFWRIAYFGQVVDLYPYQLGARFDDRQVTLPALPQNINGTFYVPWKPLAELFGVKWSIVQPTNAAESKTPSKPAANKTVFLLQYSAAYIEDVRSTVTPEKTRIVVDLSNATRVVAAQKGLDAQFFLAAARQSGVPSVLPVNDYLVPRAVMHSGNWQATFAVRSNYSAPISWFTIGNPPRLVVDVQRLFEEKSTQPIGGGLSLTKIRQGMEHGPVQMYVVRADPHNGWRVRVAPGGYSVLQRTRTSRIAQRHKALVAVNGGFFAYDGAAVGALLINGEWIRLPWMGRTAIGFRPNGQAKIGNLQAQAHVHFSGGLRIPVRDLNGWPDSGYVTALTRRFNNYYLLRPGEIAVVVKNGAVVSKPGGGGVPIHADGFTLIASGGARPWLDKVQRGERASLQIHAIGWDGYTSALGGGPRLVDNGRVEVTALREAFRADVRVGPGPRTALGLDKQGRYIILVVDGRQKYHSAGLTLTQLAYTMQKLGAVNAMNLDGGGSTAMAIRNRVVNRPSDGDERGVANALVVMR
jgi:uncharacterized protein YigE (DUF2233 family)